LRRLVVVAGGVVFGFPLFTSLALTHQTASHGAVVIALLPAATAGFAVLRARERPPGAFWLAGGAGLLAVLGFLAASGGIRGGAGPADLYLLAAVVCCALGYAEGGALARDLGGARTIAWAVVLALPITVPATIGVILARPTHAGWTAWLGFGYVTVVAMFAAFIAWYAGLARGGIARISQLQLAQPALTLLWSALLLGEHVGPLAIVAALVVVVCVALTQRVRRTASAPPRAVVGSRHG
jgi:drug/metabolite transporter (DMT)-like permease